MNCKIQKIRSFFFSYFFIKLLSILKELLRTKLEKKSGIYVLLVATLDVFIYIHMNYTLFALKIFNASCSEPGLPKYD